MSLMVDSKCANDGHHLEDPFDEDFWLKVSVPDYPSQRHFLLSEKTELYWFLNLHQEFYEGVFCVF